MLLSQNYFSWLPLRLQLSTNFGFRASSSFKQVSAPEPTLTLFSALWLPLCTAFILKSGFFMFFRKEYRYQLNWLAWFYSVWIMILIYHTSLVWPGAGAEISTSYTGSSSGSSQKFWHLATPAPQHCSEGSYPCLDQSNQAVKNNLFRSTFIICETEFSPKFSCRSRTSENLAADPVLVWIHAPKQDSTKTRYIIIFSSIVQN